MLLAAVVQFHFKSHPKLEAIFHKNTQRLADPTHSTTEALW